MSPNPFFTAVLHDRHSPVMIMGPRKRLRQMMAARIKPAPPKINNNQPRVGEISG
jgi:hypothetical protein